MRATPRQRVESSAEELANRGLAPSTGADVGSGFRFRYRADNQQVAFLHGGESATVAVQPGSYAIAQDLVPYEWAMHSVSCDNGASSTNRQLRIANVVVAAGRPSPASSRTRRICGIRSSASPPRSSSPSTSRVAARAVTSGRS